MKLNVTTVLKNMNGDDLIEPNAKGEAEPVIVRTVIINALMTPDQKDTGVQKVEKYSLAMDIQKQDEIELTPEQVVLLKETIGKPYGPVVVGPVSMLLDGKSVDEVFVSAPEPEPVDEGDTCENNIEE